LSAASVWTAIVALSVCVALVGAGMRQGVLYASGKTVASLGFVAMALAVGAASSVWGSVALAALAVAAVGDVVLAFPGTRAFLAGLAAFAVAHLLLTVAFTVRGIGTWQQVALAGGIAALAVTVAALWLRPHVDREWRAAVALYLSVIFLMTSSGIASSLHTASPLLAAGVALVAGSDAAVARHRFVREAFLNKLWGLPAYYLGMVLIALSLGA
jgi:uncharacterized membrane protein YhhN